MKKAIGIIGGMGPEASSYLYKVLIEKSISDFGAKDNDAFPEIVIHSIPVPDFISSSEKKDEALQMLKKRVIALNKLDLSCLSIACNTAHIVLKELQQISRVPFISMIDSVSQSVQKDGLKKVGILATPSTLRMKLYHKALEQYSISVVEPGPESYPALEQMIREVINGNISKKIKGELVDLADSLLENGAEGIILGCTELPLLFPKEYALPVYNSVEILADALLRSYYR